jgi:hypothetical protein
LGADLYEFREILFQACEQEGSAIRRQSVKIPQYFEYPAVSGG